MVDFDKLLNEEDSPAPIEPGELFHSLVRDPAFEYLRGIQSEVLDAWFARRGEQDSVIKMNTGAGKTLVGLLMLQSSLNEGFGPAVYLCPTKQLVQQVVQQAHQYGIPTVEFARDDREVPHECLNNEAILIGTFQKLFTGRSVFGIPGTGRHIIELGSILIDDAHSCISIAKEQVTIGFESGSPVYTQLLNIFRGSLEAQSMGTTASVLAGDPSHYIAVPHWAWIDAHQDVARILSAQANSKELRFAWDLMKDNLELCNCVIAGNRLQISPYIIPIERLPSFTQAKRRFFLSATLVDDSVLHKDFGVSKESIRSTIKPKTRGDIGERMIVSPRLIDKELTRDDTLGIIHALNQGHRNVVVLVSSEERSRYWSQQGATVGMGDDVGGVIDRLQNSSGNFVVLVNRYDGIDLPGDACRLLIIDGLPSGTSLFARYLTSSLPNSPLQRADLAQRIEQGLGRGVRSGSDYCVVFMTGTDLIAFTSRKDNHSFLSPETRRQIEIGQELAKQAQKDSGSPVEKLDALVRPCINQEQSWKRYHLTKMKNLPPVASDATRLELAIMERAAVERYNAGMALEAAGIVQAKLLELGITSGPDFGWYLQMTSALTHKAEPARAQEIQRRAHDANHYLFHPLAGIKYQRLMAKAGIQAARVLEWVSGHIDSNALPVAINALLAKIAFGVNSEVFETGWQELGELLGFESQRPEKEFGAGPDVLWAMTDGYHLVQEAKNGVLIDRTTISKSEIGQLSVSMNWFEQEYGKAAKVIPILIHPTNICNADAPAPAGTLIHDSDSSAKLHRKLREFAASLTAKAPGAWTVEEVSSLLNSHSLTPPTFREQFYKKVIQPQ